MYHSKPAIEVGRVPIEFSNARPQRPYRIRLLGPRPDACSVPLFNHTVFTLEGKAPLNVAVQAPESRDVFYFQYQDFRGGVHEYAYLGQSGTTPREYLSLDDINGYRIYVMDVLAQTLHTIEVFGSSVGTLNPILPDGAYFQVKQRPAKIIVISQGKLNLELKRYHQVDDVHKYRLARILPADWNPVAVWRQVIDQGILGKFTVYGRDLLGEKVSYTIQLRGGDATTVRDCDIATESKPTAVPVAVQDGNVMHMFAFVRSDNGTYTYRFDKTITVARVFLKDELPAPLPYIVRLTTESGEDVFDFQHDGDKPHAVIDITVLGVPHRFERAREDGRVLEYRRMK